MDDFDELIDPGTLAHNFLGPEPSPYVLRAIAKEDKSKFLVLAYPFFFLIYCWHLVYGVLCKDDDEV